MLENNGFIDKDYRPVLECIKEINILYNLHLNKSHSKAVHKALQNCKWLKNKPALTKDGKPSTKYYIRQLRKFNNPNNDHIWGNEEYGYEYDKQYDELGRNLEKTLGIKILQDYNPSQLNTEEKFKIKITEDQLKRLKHLLQ